MPTDSTSNNVVAFARYQAPSATEETPAKPTNPDELRAAIEAMTPEQFETFDSVVKFANYLLDHKLEITSFVACVALPGPEESTAYTVASTAMPAGEFALAVRMLDRQLDKMLG